MAKKQAESVLEEITGSDFEPIEESIVQGPSEDVADIKDRQPPLMEEVEWENYVLSFFEPHELEQGLPKVRGLRRIIRLLFGPTYGTARVIQCPDLNNGQRATVEYTIKVTKVKHLQVGEEYGQVIEFTDAADAWPHNISGAEYGKYPTANAVTRAEGRALRKALCLDVIAAEEISDVPPEESGFSGAITEGQITRLDVKCEQLKIDVMKFIGLGKYTRVEDVPYNKVIRMFQVLSNYQRGEDDNKKPLLIPEKIKGYNPNWRSEK